MPKILPSFEGGSGGASAILQVVESVTTTEFKTTSGSLVVAHSLNITPLNISSKILLFLCASIECYYSAGSQVYFNAALYKGVSELWNNRFYLSITGGTKAKIEYPINTHIIDSPATLSPVTYDLKISKFLGDYVAISCGSIYPTKLTAIEFIL